MTFDTVAGLELNAVRGHYGVYLQCDRCGQTLDARRQNEGQPNERISADEEELRERARTLGWTGPMSRSQIGDLCPTCTREANHAN